jgi:hypothetical protein
MRFPSHYFQKKVPEDNTNDLIRVSPPLFYPELLSPPVLSPSLEPSQQSAYKTKQETRVGGKSRSLLGAIKIQQWRGNPSPTPYSTLSKGSKIPNLRVAADPKT